MVRLKEDFQKDYTRFAFPGFVGEGACFLRVKAKKSTGKLIFLCAQLSGYHGTSVTNAVERIFAKAIKTLKEEGVLLSAISSLPKIAKDTIWIEHYPASVGVYDTDTYALVGFDAHLSPIWNFTTPEELGEMFGIDAKFFAVEKKLLRYGSAR